MMEQPESRQHDDKFDDEADDRFGEDDSEDGDDDGDTALADDSDAGSRCCAEIDHGRRDAARSDIAYGDDSSKPMNPKASQAFLSSLFSSVASCLLVPFRALTASFNALPSRWRNWFVRGISGSTLIAGFGFIIHMGPVALMLLSIIAAVGCYHEITIISYNVHRASNVPWIRSLCYYYLFTLLYLFYGDSIARHVNDALIAANDNAVDVIAPTAARDDDARNDAVAAATGIQTTSVVVSGDGVGGISDFLEGVERFHPTTSFVLYVIGLAVGFLPLTIKAAKRGVGGGGKRRRSKGGETDKTSSTSLNASAVSPSRLSPPPSNSSSSSSATALLKKQFVIFAWSHMALLLILFPSHFAVVNIAVGGHLWFLIPVSIVIFNDIAAYSFGFCFGKTPLIALSPKKTWEGFLGGGFSTLIFGAVFSGWYLESALPTTTTLKQLESLTLKSAAAELRRRGVVVELGGVGETSHWTRNAASAAAASAAAASAAAASSVSAAAAPADTKGAPSLSPSPPPSPKRREREIVLRLDHYVCRVNVSRWKVVRGFGERTDDDEKVRNGGESDGGGGSLSDGGGSSGGGSGGGSGGRRLSWEEVASKTICDRTAILKLTNYSLPDVATSMWETLSGQTVHQVEIYPFQLHAFVFSVFGSLIAPFGGFFASGLKRAFKIKDFGAIIPGHGGLVDRFDCQLFMSFFVFVYHYTFIEPGYEGNEGSYGSMRGYGGGGGGGAGGFGRRRSAGVGGDPIGTSPLEIVKRVVNLEAEDQLWLYERLRESLLWS